MFPSIRSRAYPRPKLRRMMSFMGETDGFDPEILVNGYPWASVGSGSGTIVDVGGSHGSVMLSIASRFPSLKYIIQDLPATIEEARRQLPVKASQHLDFMPQYVPILFSRAVLADTDTWTVISSSLNRYPQTSITFDGSSTIGRINTASRSYRI
jgi:hypothetical protein